MQTSKNTRTVWRLRVTYEMMGDTYSYLLDTKYDSIDDAETAMTGLNEHHEEIKSGRRFSVEVTYEHTL